MNETTTKPESWTAELARDGATIAPSLLAADFANLEREVRRLEAGGGEGSARRRNGRAARSEH